MNEQKTRLRNAGFVTFFFSGKYTIKKGRAAVLVMDKYEVAPCKGGEKSAGQFRLVPLLRICAFILKIAIFLIFV